MSIVNPRDEWESLVSVLDRMSRRYPLVDDEEIRQLIADELERLGDARMRAYIPQLVERRVRDQLRLTLAA